MKKIVFTFNQMVSPTFTTGGDALSKEVLEFARRDPELKVVVTAPKFAKKCFDNKEVLTLGDNFFEKFFDFNRVYTYLLTYLGRTIEFNKKYKNLELDVIYSTGDFFCNTIPAYSIKKKNKNVFWTTCIYHINESPIRRNVHFTRGLVSYLSQRLSFYFIKKNCDVIFVLSKLMKIELRNLGFKNEIVASGAGLHLKLIEKQLSKIGKKSSTSDLVYFNRLNSTKGIYDLPEVLSRVLLKHPNTKLHIIGGADEHTANKLKKRFEKKKCLKNVVFYGYIKDKKRIYEILSSCKVFLQPSYEEGWSIVLHEAILCGCIPVVYDLPIYREVFEDLLFTAPMKNKSSFASQVIKALSLNNEEHEKNAKRLYSVTKKFDWSNVYLKQREYLLSEK